MTSNHPNPPSGSNTVVPLPGIHEEALQLLVEAHNYFSRNAQKEMGRLSERERTMYLSEMSRVTIRLSCVMAWLLARRAVLEGQLTTAEAGANYRLECREVCMNQHIEAESILPGKLVDLLDRTLDLYQRVARLDKVPDGPAT
jgi:regulator of CtrA degradation